MSDYQTVQEIKGYDVNIAAPFRSILILRRKTVKTAKNGNPFLSIELGDSGGSFNANCFGDSDVFKALEVVAEGSIIRLSGKTEYYQERLSPRLQAAEAIDAAIEEHGLDALLFPGSGGAGISARPGYPTVIVPFALLDGEYDPPMPEGFDVQPRPFGVSFAGGACSEPRLIALAYAFEQASARRIAPLWTR